MYPTDGATGVTRRRYRSGAERKKTETLDASTKRARTANDHLAETAARLRFVARVPFLCECDDPGCCEFVLLSVEDYHLAKAQAITAPRANCAQPNTRSLASRRSRHAFLRL